MSAVPPPLPSSGPPPLPPPAVSFPPLPPPLPVDAVPEVSAQGKFSCALCGGEAHWNPTKQALVCIYCGGESPARVVNAATGQIEEHSLTAALRALPADNRGWGTETHSVRCTSCAAVTVFPPGRVSQRCDFCGSTALVPNEDTHAPIRPEALLPFHLGEPHARDAARVWYRTRWFAPNALKTGAFTDQMRGFYLPYWTFDAYAHCPWTAEAGHHYYTTESYTDSKGDSQSRQVQHTRWVPASGTVEHLFDDVLVPASKGAPPALLNGVEPFPTTEQLTVYDPSYLAGWLVEQYQLDLAAAAREAGQKMEAHLRNLASKMVPGDTQRNLHVYPTYSRETFKHVLLPVWIVSYLYSGKHYPLLVNGYTGTVAGRYPKSWVKITLLVLGILLALLIAGLLFHHSR